MVAFAEVISSVKEALEENHGPIGEVSVTAAGRALKTVQGTQQLTFFNNRLLKKKPLLF